MRPTLTSASTSLDFDPQVLSTLFHPGDKAFRLCVENLLREDVFRPRYGETVSTSRWRCRRRLDRLYSAGLFEGFNPRCSTSLRRYFIIKELVTLLDPSLDVFCGATFELFACTVANLGTKEQRDRWLPLIVSGEEFGCFALTELGHGSNVRGIETMATYDDRKQAFIINTPSETAQKYWIGGAAEAATLTVAFARLVIDGEDKGIHVFIVRLRDRDGKLSPGITVADCGVKAGLNGVDNGRIWFDNVVVPRENMLCAKASVARDGSYTTSYRTPDALFAATLAALTGGRVSISCNAVLNAMVGLTIAVRYCLSRRAFAPNPGLPEVPLLYYTSMQRRLMIPLAAACVYLPCALALREDWYRAVDSGVMTRNVHSTSAAFKALFSWFMVDTLQAARESCGGQGYALHNRIAFLRMETEIMVTFEGANDVLMQQVARPLLAVHQRAQKTGIYTAPDMRVLNTDGILEKPLYTILVAREKRLLEELGSQYKVAVTSKSPFDAWNDCLDIAERAARAHAHRRIAEIHASFVEKCGDVGVQRVLAKCGQLWMAAEIESDPDVLRLGCIDARKSRSISQSVSELCREIADTAHLIVEAFEIPRFILDHVPIGNDYVAFYSRAKL